MFLFVTCLPNTCFDSLVNSALIYHLDKNISTLSQANGKKPINVMKTIKVHSYVYVIQALLLHEALLWEALYRFYNIYSHDDCDD